MVRETRRAPRSLPSVHLIGIDVVLLSANGGQLGVNSVLAHAVLREGRRRRDGEGQICRCSRSSGFFVMSTRLSRPFGRRSMLGAGATRLRN